MKDRGRLRIRNLKHVKPSAFGDKRRRAWPNARCILLEYTSTWRQATATNHVKLGPFSALSDVAGPTS